MKPDSIKINILGNSITEGRDASRYENSYVSLLQNQKLLRRFHDKLIVIATSLHRLDEDGTICEERKMVAPLWEYVRILKETAAYFGFPVIDLFSTSGLQPNIDYIRKTYTADGLHPNDAGHALLFQRVDTALRHLL